MGMYVCCTCVYVYVYVVFVRQVCTQLTHVVGFGVPLFPLHQDELRYDERDDEDEHHLSMHGFMTFVFGVHSRMFQSGSQTKTHTFRTFSTKQN